MLGLILGLACGPTDTGLTQGGGGGDTVPGTGRLSLSTEEVTIVDVDPGYSKSGQFTVTSIGDANLIIYEIRIVADATDSFYFDEVEDVTLAPKQSATYTVVADLAESIVATGELRLRTNDPDYASYNMPLSAYPLGWSDTGGGGDTGGDTGSTTE